MDNTNDTVSVQGYALLWDVKYVMGEYVESVSRGALAGADMSEVKLLVDHDFSLLLASTGGGTLKLTIDNKGLFFKASLPMTDVGVYTAEMVSRRDLTQTSWGFTLDKKSGSNWSTLESGVAYRVITKVNKLWDVSICTYPANPKTWVTLSDNF